MVVWECCKDEQQSRWEMLNFDPATKPGPIKRLSPNLAYVITSRIPSTKKKLGWGQSVKGFLLPIYATYTVSVVVVCLLIFWFFQLPTSESPAWILTLNMSNDAVLHKDVPFDGYKSDISYLSAFLGKFKKITIVSMGKYLNCHNSSPVTCKLRVVIFGSTVQFSGSTCAS